jgi:hypothetical protein
MTELPILTGQRKPVNFSCSSRPASAIVVWLPVGNSEDLLEGDFSTGVENIVDIEGGERSAHADKMRRFSPSFELPDALACPKRGESS